MCSEEIWQSQFVRQIDLFKRIKTTKESLKFDRRYIIPSDIGSQFYCEQKLEQEYLTGKIVTEEMLQGDEGHAKIVEDFRPVTIEEAWRNIYTKDKFMLAEFIFITPYKKVYIIGRPDIVLFIGGMPILVFEFKFSNYSEDFLSRHAQAQSYGLILKELGLEIKNLFYSIIVFKPGMIGQKEFIKTIPQKVATDFFNGNITDAENNSKMYGDIKAYIHKFYSREAEKHIDWAIGYWTGDREACYTETKEKCYNCIYSQNCPNK